MNYPTVERTGRKRFKVVSYANKKEWCIATQRTQPVLKRINPKTLTYDRQCKVCGTTLEGVLCQD